MSIERSFVVRIPRGDEEFEVRRLQASAAAALERHRRAPIGDLTEAVRYEHIEAAIAGIAFAELGRVLNGSPSTQLSDIEVEVYWPFGRGPSDLGTVAAGPKPVASVFRSELERPRRQEVTQERFHDQLLRLVGERPQDESCRVEALNPSEIPDRVVSSSLRQFCEAVPGRPPVVAPVVYRDGSLARAVRLRSLHFEPAMPADSRRLLRVTLLSVRHMEMDFEVDGAWLRNREISLRRPAGQTDELVYRQSQVQLEQLAAQAPLELHLYQTGLAAAVMGFFRALVDHHLEGRGHPVAVLPKYYIGEGKFDDAERPWVVAP